MPKVYLSLGSNMGQKVDYLDKAVDYLKKNDFIHMVKVSSYYQTDPVGYEDQDVFVNIVVELETDLSPYKMLDLCQQIENDLDRVRLIRWGPRTIDVDIVLFEDIQLDEAVLTIPHPRMHERAFVLVPLKEIASDIVVNNRHIDELLGTLDVSGVRKL